MPRLSSIIKGTCGAIALVAIVGSITLMILSRGDPWRFGQQHEPYWSWAIGSGRLKLWIAEPGVFTPTDSWTSSWYRGLDGSPIRWDFTMHRGSTGGVVVMAIPFWSVALGGITLGVGVFGYPTLRRTRRRRRGRCLKCGYDLAGTVDEVCPECGMALLLRKGQPS